MSKTQLKKVLVIAQSYSKNYCTPNITFGTAKAWVLVFVDKNSLGAGTHAGEEPPWLETQGSVQCWGSIQGQVHLV